jgi:hypothetical protein
MGKIVLVAQQTAAERCKTNTPNPEDQTMRYDRNDKWSKKIQFCETELQQAEFRSLARFRRQPESVIRRDACSSYIRAFARKHPQFARELARIRKQFDNEP